MDNVRTVADLAQIRCNALAVCLFENRLVRILSQPKELHSHAGEYLKLCVRRTGSDNRNLQITGRIILIELMEIRNHLITQFKEIDEFRVNERLKQNADDVGGARR